GTSYAAFRRIQSLLTRIYDEVRDEKARELYGKPLSELPEEAQDAVRQLVPIGIFEMEMKKP
nr:biopolymer transporter ExbD [Bacteroidales bacterium]